METGAQPPRDTTLRSRSRLIVGLARWLSLGLAALSLAFVWNQPRTRPWPLLAIIVGYAAFTAATQALNWRRNAGRPLRVVHDLVDAFAVAGGAALSGGLTSPLWLLLYPHVVAVSVRASLRYALAVGVLDSILIFLLTAMTPEEPLGAMHALALIFCAFMGGLTSTQLRKVKDRLARVNDELHARNEQLSSTLQAHEATLGEQERTVARLSISEERYGRLLERIQDGVLIVQDGRIVYSNRVFAELVADTAERLAGAPFGELVPADDRKDIEERYRLWEENQSVSAVLESRLLTRRGGSLLVSLRGGSAEYAGRPAVIATVRDITRERRMEQDVRAHAVRLAAINEIANAVNLSLTIEDIFAVAAEEAQRLVPFDRLTIALLDEEGPGVDVVAVGYGARRQRADFQRQDVSWAFRRPNAWAQGAEAAPPHVASLLADQGVRAIATVPLLSKDRVIGSLNLGRLKPEPFSTFDLGVLEPVARHIAIALDNARLIEAVRRRGHEFESLLDVGRGIVERLELDELLPMVTRSVNRVMGTRHCILLLRSGETLSVAAQEGLEPEIVDALRGLKIGDSLSGWVAREARPLAVTDMRADPRFRFTAIFERFGYRSYLCVPLRRGPDVLGTLEVLTKEPRVFSEDEQELMTAFAAQAAVAIENAKLFEEARASLHKVTEANRRLEELDRMRQEYLRNVSHEFRSPLTVIKGYAEFLADAGSPGEGALRDMTRIMVESCDRVIDMVDTLIEVSRIEQGAAERTLQLQTVDAHEVVATAIDPLRGLALKKGVHLEMEVPSGALPIEGDLGLLTQVVRKLVDNALKYSPQGGVVAVRARHAGDELVLEVEDGGIGIAPEHIHRIFEKFYMVDGGITRRVGGTGVGLYLVREIVRLHRGSVHVRSLVGQGSTFSVHLPRRTGQAHTQAALA